MIISNYCGIAFSATLELIKPDETLALNEAVKESSAVLNLEFNKPLFDFLTRSCKENVEIHLIMKNLKVEKSLADVPGIEAVKNLTECEYQVLKCLSEGLSYEATAKCLFKALETVKSHVSNIFGKLNVHTRYQASDKFMKFQLLYPLYEIDKN